MIESADRRIVTNVDVDRGSQTSELFREVGDACRLMLGSYFLSNSGHGLLRGPNSIGNRNQSTKHQAMIENANVDANRGCFPEGKNPWRSAAPWRRKLLLGALGGRALWRRILPIALTLLVACGGSTKPAPKPTGGGTGNALVQYGQATWYGGSLHGGPTASGERFDKNALTAAHRTLRMQTRVRVTNQRNGRSVILRINDRGPYGKAIIDVSERAAEILDMKEAGRVPVKLEVLR
jgi:rare lipoprotein A